MPLFACRVASDSGAFQPQRVIQIRVDALELRGPRDQRIRLVGIQHVSHRQPHRIQIVLDAQQLQRIFDGCDPPIRSAACAVPQIALVM